MNEPPFEFLSDVIRHHARQRGAKPALIFADRQTTYAEFERYANQVAHALLREQLQPGSRIGVLSLNTDRFFLAWHGATRSRVVITPVNFRLAAAEIQFILNDAGVQLLLVGEAFVGLVRQIASVLPQLKRIVALDDADNELPPGWIRWNDWISDLPDLDPALESSTTDTAIQYYSSGTTGFPKGVEVTHANLLRHTPVWLKENGQWDETDVSLVPMPLFHVAGATYGSAALVVGGTVVIHASPDPAAILDAISRLGITRTCLVPAIIQGMLAHPYCRETDFSRLRRILYGASPISLSLARQATAVMGHCLEQTYGTTESGGGFTRLAPEDHLKEDKLASCGRPMPYVQVRVVDESGKNLPVGGIGEIEVRGETVMKAYWNSPEADRSLQKDGWLRTSDVGYFDADGYLFVVDRLNDMIITGGENVYPAEVENVLFEHPDVAEVAVFGVPDEQWGESVMAAIVPAAGTSPVADEIIRFCRQRIAAFKCPKSIELVTALPRNATGKVLKKDLRRPYWEGWEDRSSGGFRVNQ